MLPRVAERRATLSSKQGDLKSFHEAIIPTEVIRTSEFERSFSTKLGTTFEERAHQSIRRFSSERSHSTQVSKSSVQLSLGSDATG